MFQSPDPIHSVESAAEFLTVSEATIRRLCVSGQIVATKAGRAWIIPESALIAFQAISGDHELLDLVDLPAALKYVRKWDIKRELWRPDTLGFGDELSDKSALLEAVRLRLVGSVPLDPPARSRYPKSPILFRNASDLSLVDRVAYEAVVAAMAPVLDSFLSDRVYNNRLTDRTTKRSGVTEPWQRFVSATEAAVKDREGWLVKSDIASFFDFIDHGSLFAKLTAAGVNEHLIRALRGMLATWGLRLGAGLPQGPDASRLLANFFLSELDEAVLDHRSVDYFRFMDDVRIVAQSRSEAVKALETFTRGLDRLGLPVSSYKTEAFDPESAIIEVQADDLRGEEYALEEDVEILREGDEWVMTAVDHTTELKRIFFESLLNPAKLDKRRATFSLHRLVKTDDREVLNEVLARLEDLAPVAGVVVNYLRPRLGEDDVIQGILAYISDPERNMSEYLEHWLIALLVDSSEPMPPGVYSELRRRYADKNFSSHLRGCIASLLLRAGRAADVRAIEEELSNTGDVRLARDLLVALARAGRLNARTRAAAVVRFASLKPLVDYLAGTSKLPDMIVRRAPHFVDAAVL